MGDSSGPNHEEFSYRNPTILRKEIRFNDMLKARLTDKMYRFTTRVNFVLSEYSVLLIRNSARSNTHLVYRQRNKARSKIQNFSALVNYLETNSIEYDSKKILAIEIFRLDVNDEWARMEYGRLKTLAYRDAFKEANSHFPEEMQLFLDTPYLTAFEEINSEPSFESEL